jgi:dynein assembly factor 5
VPFLSEVDVRLSLLALIEEMIRLGASDWACGTHIGAACECLITQILIPNLVWRVGRVEATVRKVSLAACYGLLRAGAAQPQCLYAVAGQLVPLIASHMDDSEHTPRVMSVYCLSVLFERLRGAFADQSLSELYPKLLKRLDDSNDDVRIAVCVCLQQFFQCGASPSAYSNTLLQYSLEQLLIHLDDANEQIQDAIEPVIVQISKLDKALVEKMCEASKHTHRTPYRCEKVLEEVRGYRIMDA